MIKKLLAFLTVFTLCSLHSFAKEYHFNVSSNAGEDAENHWNATLIVTPNDMKFSLDKTLMDFQTFIPIPKEKVMYYNNAPIVGFLHSTKDFSYGGKENELWVISDKGVIIFGIYIDRKEIGYDKHHYGYILIPNSKGELKAQETHLIDDRYYTQYIELLDLCKQVIADINKDKGAQKPSASTQKKSHTTTGTTNSTSTTNVKQQYRLPEVVTPYDVITKPFGLYIEKPFSIAKIKKALTSCGISYKQLSGNEIETSQIPITICGKKPTHWKFTAVNSAGIPIQVFNFVYPMSVWSQAQAIAFAKKLVEGLTIKGYTFKDYSKQLAAEYAQICVVNFTSGKYRFDVMVRHTMIGDQFGYIVTIGTMKIN